MGQLYTRIPSEKKTVKTIITEKVLIELKEPLEPLQQYINEWWYTKSSEGLRLNKL